jgi:hypothetical protein
MLSGEHKDVLMKQLRASFNSSLRMSARLVQEKFEEELAHIEQCCQEDDLVRVPRGGHLGVQEVQNVPRSAWVKTDAASKTANATLVETHTLAVSVFTHEVHSPPPVPLQVPISVSHLLPSIFLTSLCGEQITVFDIGKNQDLDLAILSALLKGRSARPIDQLQLALKWNRVDVAVEKLFTDTDLYQPGELDELMTEALATNKIDFVRILLVHGVAIKEYLTVDRLRYLYNTVHLSSFFRFKIFSCSVLLQIFFTECCPVWPMIVHTFFYAT